MAYTNQDQGNFVPYHQLIDLRSANPPLTFVPGPPIGAISPCNAPVMPQLVPLNSPVVASVGFVWNPAFWVRVEEERSRWLLKLVEDEGLVPSPEDEIKRKNAIEKLKQIVMEWIKRVARQRRLPRQHIATASATVLTFGSYGLGVHNSESDIDALCVVPRFATMAEDFFIGLHSMLISRPEVSEIHCVKDAKVPLMRFKLDGISIDLPYAQLRVLYVPENVDILNPFFLRDVDETSWRSLSGVHANKCILRLIPNIEVYQSLLRCIRLWAKRRGVYGNLLGFFGGVHLAILVAFICQRHPNTSLSSLMSSFFKTFAFWPWPTPIILQDGVLPVTTTERLSLIPIRLPFRPREYCHSNITKSTFHKIRAEFLRGHALTKDLPRPDFDWTYLFNPFRYTKKYPQFLKICLSASDQEELGQWVGWAKSRFRGLLAKLEDIKVFCDPNPTEYVDANVAEPNIVFYWGLLPGESGFLDTKSIEEDFVKSTTIGYQGPIGRTTISVVGASQLPKNAQFDTESDNGSKVCCGKLEDCNHPLIPVDSTFMPPDVQFLTADAKPEFPSAKG